METPDRIIGKKINGIIDQLQKEKTILKLNILDIGYKGLSIVIGVDSDERNSFFLIDYPGGSRDILAKASGKVVFIEFNDLDNIQYSFRSVVEKVAKDSIWIRFPEGIDRKQRRRYFRIATPPGTRITFEMSGRRYELNVINLSEGGALTNQKASHHEEELFCRDGELRNIFLVRNEGDLRASICIKKTRIVRIKKNPETGRYSYGLQFLEMGIAEKEDIRKFIYKCQRRDLKSRSFL